MTTYTYQDIQRGRMLGFFVWAMLVLAAMLSVWATGCGDATVEPPRADLPVVEITCGNGCIILAHNTVDIEAYYGDALAWWDTNTDPARRLTYVDDPPAGFTVVACNPAGCVEANR